MSAQEDRQAQSQNQRIRECLGNAYAAVEAQKNVQSFSAFTFDDALQAQNDRIEGADTDARPNELHRIDKVQADVQAAVSQVKALPPDAFVEADDDRDVNTPA